MRICFITTHFGPYRGGSTLFADLFARMKERHDVTVLTREDRYARRSWKTEHVQSRSSGKFAWLTELLFARAAVRRFRQLHRERPFDLVFVNQVNGLALLKLHRARVPIIFMVHHPISVDRELALQESRHLAEWLGWFLQYGPMVSVQKRLARSLGYTLTVSYAARERMSRDYGIAFGDIAIILNGVDVDYFHKTLDTEPRSILTVGSYQHPRRGFRYLVQSYRELTKRGFTIVDTGRRTNTQEKLLKSIPGVQIRGLIEGGREEMRDLYSRASVLISTSLYEGFGLSLAEALACGTPVVAFDAGGVREVLEPIDPQMVCPVADVTCLIEKAAALSEMLHRAETGEAYHAMVAKHFSLARMAAEYDSLFAAAVSGVAWQKVPQGGTIGTS